MPWCRFNVGRKVLSGLILLGNLPIVSNPIRGFFDTPGWEALMTLQTSKTDSVRRVARKRSLHDGVLA